MCVCVSVRPSIRPSERAILVGDWILMSVINLGLPLAEMARHSIQIERLNDSDGR